MNIKILQKTRAQTRSWSPWVWYRRSHYLWGWINWSHWVCLYCSSSSSSWTSSSSSGWCRSIASSLLGFQRLFRVSILLLLESRRCAPSIEFESLSDTLHLAESLERPFGLKSWTSGSRLSNSWWSMMMLNIEDLSSTGLQRLHWSSSSWMDLMSFVARSGIETAIGSIDMTTSSIRRWASLASDCSWSWITNHKEPLRNSNSTNPWSRFWWLRFEYFVSSSQLQHQSAFFRWMARRNWGSNWNSSSQVESILSLDLPDHLTASVISLWCSWIQWKRLAQTGCSDSHLCLFGCYWGQSLSSLRFPWSLWNKIDSIWWSFACLWCLNDRLSCCLWTVAFDSASSYRILSVFFDSFAWHVPKSIWLAVAYRLFSHPRVWAWKFVSRIFLFLWWKCRHLVVICKENLLLGHNQLISTGYWLDVGWFACLKSTAWTPAWTGRRHALWILSAHWALWQSCFSIPPDSWIWAWRACSSRGRRHLDHIAPISTSGFL